MREPSKPDAVFAWWREALALLAAGGAGLRAKIGQPHPGLYRTRLTRGGPWVPASISLYQDIAPDTGELMDDERLVYTVNGRERPAEALERDWPFLWQNAIGAQEFQFMEAARQHAERYEPNHPKARPERPIDPLTSPIPF